MLNSQTFWPFLTWPTKKSQQAGCSKTITNFFIYYSTNCFFFLFIYLFIWLKIWGFFLSAFWFIHSRLGRVSVRNARVCFKINDYVLMVQGFLFLFYFFFLYILMPLSKMCISNVNFFFFLSCLFKNFRLKFISFKSTRAVRSIKNVIHFKAAIKNNRT